MIQTRYITTHAPPILHAIYSKDSWRVKSQNGLLHKLLLLQIQNWSQNLSNFGIYIQFPCVLYYRCRIWITLWRASWTTYKKSIWTFGARNCYSLGWVHRCSFRNHFCLLSVLDYNLYFTFAWNQYEAEEFFLAFFPSCPVPQPWHLTIFLWIVNFPSPYSSIETPNDRVACVFWAPSSLIFIFVFINQ